MSVLDKLMGSLHLTENDDDEYFDDDEYETERSDRRGAFSGARDDEDYDDEDTKPSFFGRSSNKVVPMKRSMEVILIKPSTIDDGSHIVDSLLANKTVVLNMEGIPTEHAQRIIDFTSGATYSMNGKLQKISNYIFIVTPKSVELSGDFQDLLSTSNIDVSGLNIHF